MAAVDLRDIDDQTMQTLRKAFATLDKTKCGFIPTSEMNSVLTGLGTTFDTDDLQEAIGKVDIDNLGKVNFEGFVTIVAAFLEDDDDDSVIIEELRQAFLMYDKEGNGFITTKVLREILRELDNKLSEQDLNDIIEDIDVDDKGTIDFEDFKELML